MYTLRRHLITTFAQEVQVQVHSLCLSLFLRQSSHTINSLTDLGRCSPRPHWSRLAFHKKLLLLNYKRFFFFLACLYKAMSLILADWNMIKGTIKWPEMQLAAYYPFLSFQPFCTCVFLVMVIFPEPREMHLLYIQLWSKLFLKKTFTENVPVLQEYVICVISLILWSMEENLQG